MQLRAFIQCFLSRFEIEKKLRLAKKQEMRKKRDQEKKKEEKMDAKERSKERKKTVEENRGKVDKKAAAMNMLKARREEKRERGKKGFIFLLLLGYRQM